MRRLQAYTEKYDGAGRLSSSPLLQTHYMVSKLKLDPCFCANVSKERFANWCKVSSNTPRPHTPWRLKFTLRSLTQVTVLHLILCLVYHSTKHTTFLKISLISHPATVFLFCNLSCTRNLTKPPLFWEGNEKIFPGDSPRTPFLLQTPHKHPHQLRHWAWGNSAAKESGNGWGYLQCFEDEGGILFMKWLSGNSLAAPQLTHITSTALHGYRRLQTRENQCLSVIVLNGIDDEYFSFRWWTSYFPQVGWLTFCVFYLLSRENCWRNSSCTYFVQNDNPSTEINAPYPSS